MRDVLSELTAGERVAFHRRRRGITQVALAGLIGRTESWLEKIESGRAPLDRISVVRELAQALDISLRDLVPDFEPETGGEPRSVHPQAPVLTYRAVNPRFALSSADLTPVRIDQLRVMVDDVWHAYQDSSFGYAVTRLNNLLPLAYLTAQSASDRVAATQQLAHLYQLAASVLVKLGDVELARLCADRGDIAAQEAGDSVTRMSLQRSIAHSLLSEGNFADAVCVVRDGVVQAGGPVTPAETSVLGTLMLVGATASARAGERREAAAFLRHCHRLADRLGRDGNEVWTSFGPTNVAIHEVTVAAYLGDASYAARLGTQIDVSGVPRERRIRHQLEVAGALSRIGNRDDALKIVVMAELDAPDQVRRHVLTRQLVDGWMRQSRGRADPRLVAIARRVGHAA